MTKIAVLGWGSLVWDPRDLQAAAKFAPNGPLLPIEFCRISGDGRLTLVIDETFGAVCTTCSARSAIEDLDAAIENLRVREGMQKGGASAGHDRHREKFGLCRARRRTIIGLDAILRERFSNSRTTRRVAAGGGAPHRAS